MNYLDSRNSVERKKDNKIKSITMTSELKKWSKLELLIDQTLLMEAIYTIEDRERLNRKLKSFIQKTIDKEVKEARKKWEKEAMHIRWDKKWVAKIRQEERKKFKKILRELQEMNSETDRDLQFKYGRGKVDKKINHILKEYE